MNFSTLSISLCSTEVPWFLGIFDFSTAPPLLFYSYIPIVISALLIGLYAYVKDKRSLQSKALLALTIFFVLWVLNILVQWVASYHTVLMFSWQLTAIFEVGLYLSTAYFAYVFLFKKDLSFIIKGLFFIISLAVLVLLPTNYNIFEYDVQNCQGTNGLLWMIIYGLEPAVIILIVSIAIGAYRRAIDFDTKRQIIIFTTGIAVFMSFFFLSNYFGELTLDYEFNLWGPAGMVVFLILLAYLIVKYNAFNTKLIATQALIGATTLLIGARVFYSTSTEGLLLSVVTFVAFAFGGFFLNRSVKKEVEQRETIEGLAKKLEEQNLQLEEANGRLKLLDQQKSEFVSIASHQLRSPLTVIKGYLSMFLEGEEALGNVKAGTITKKGVEVMDTMFQSTIRLAHIIEDFLNVSRIEQGRMKYEMSDFDIRQMSTEVMAEFKAAVAQKGISLSFEDKTPSESYMVNADSGKIRQVIGNVIDNSIKYTPQGGITVYLERLQESVKISIKDTGIGISPENLKNLFQKFARATNAGKVNVTGSGLGLFVAIEIMKAHGGKLYAESEGEGKGSAFIVELPLKR